MLRVSVIMAVRNSEQYISQAIESVLVQSYKNFEFIIVDDFSSDSTYKIIKDFEKNDSRIKVIRNLTKKGPAESRNIAIHFAEGKWVSVIDSDDVFFPKKIEKQVDLVNKNKNIIFVGSSLLFIDNSGSHIAFYKYKNDSYTLKGDIIKNKSFPPHSSYFIKKSYIKKINGYNKRYLMAPDYDLLLRLQAFHNKEFAVCEDVLTKVRLHDQNRSLKKIDNFSQLDFAILASTCFQIYEKFNKNPARDLNDSEWMKFMSTFKSFLSSLDYYNFLVDKLRYKKRKKINEYIKYFFNINFLKSYFTGHIMPNKIQKKFFLIYKKKFLK
jgi:glycosyltransferase involved in cell wall biosynthesis